MTKGIKYICLFLGTLFFSCGNAVRVQPSEKVALQPFTVYVFKGRYDEKGKQYIEENEALRQIYLLGGVHIDPKKKGVVDLKTVDKHINSIFPNLEDRGILCINLENKFYHNLRDKEKGTILYNEAVGEFQKLIGRIRQLRPNVKLGIYGLPYRTYYPSQQKWNDDNKLDSVLSQVDFLFPSLYVLYPDKQKGEKANDDYWKTNLDTAFAYGDRLGKPVIPFVWYMVTPGNKKYGGELLGKKEMKRYLDFIRNYSSNNDTQIQGVIWWESSKAAFEKNIKLPSHINENLELNSSVILKEYIELI